MMPLTQYLLCWQVLKKYNLSDGDQVEAIVLQTKKDTSPGSMFMAFDLTECGVTFAGVVLEKGKPIRFIPGVSETAP